LESFESQLQPEENAQSECVTLVLDAVKTESVHDFTLEVDAPLGKDDDDNTSVLMECEDVKDETLESDGMNTVM
jgi:hypothetical protein